MSLAICPQKLRDATAILGRVHPEAQLTAFKNLCENNGVWMIPETPPTGTKEYRPVLFEASLFGIHATATEADDLPRNWMRAARNTLEYTDPATPPATHERQRPAPACVPPPAQAGVGQGAS